MNRFIYLRKLLEFADESALKKLLNALEAVSKMKNFFDNPFVDINNKLDELGIEEPLRTPLYEYFRTIKFNFSGEFQRLVNDFKFWYYRKKNKREVEIYLAFKKDRKDIEKISRFIKSLLKSEIVCSVKIDKNIIGGFYADSYGMILDGSIRGYIERCLRT